MRSWITTPLVCAIVAAQAHAVRAFEATDRWNVTAVTGSTGSTGSPVTVTWGIVDDGTQVPDGVLQVPSDLIAMLDEEFAGGRTEWFPVFTDAFDRLGALSGLDFLYEGNDDGIRFSSANRGIQGVRPDIRIGGRSYGSGSTTLASNFFPDYGEMVVNTDRGTFFDNPFDDFRALRNTIMHEALHGVGLSHVDASSPGFLMEPSITTAFDGPQLDDILGMQRLYGDVYEKNGGNDAWSAATPLGTVSELQTALIGQDGSTTGVTDTQSDFVSIDDNSDIDFFSFTVSETLDVTVELRPQGASYQTGPEGGPVNSMDSRLLSDLTLTLFDTNGFTALGTSNSAGAGGVESLAMPLDAGTYFARVTGAQNDIQLYQLSVAVAGEPENITWTGQVNSLWDLQTTANFDDGSGPDVFANLDTVTFDDSASQKSVSLVGSLNPAAVVFDASDDYQIVGSGSLTGGSLTVNGPGTVEVATSGNSYSGPTQINGGTLIFSGDTSAMISQITIASGGTLVMDSAIAGGNASSFLIEPGGTLQVGRISPNSNADVFPNDPVSLVNNGVLRIVDFESVGNISGSGDVVAAEELALLGNNSYTGQTRVEDGGSIQPTDDVAFGTADGNTVVEAGGFIVIRVDSFSPDSLGLEEDFVFAGNGNGLGALQVTDAANIGFQGSWTIASGGGTIGISEASTAALGGLFNAVDGQATLDVSGGSNLYFDNSATIGNQGLVKSSPGDVTFTATANFFGKVDIQEGRLAVTGNSSFSGEVRIASGASLQLAGANSFTNAASITGNGTVLGDLTLPGAISPGDSTIGALSIQGDLTLSDSSEMIIQIGGSLAGQYDRIDVNDLALIDGTLTVELIDLGSGIYEPQAGDSFGFLAALDGTGGQFDDIDLPSLSPGLDWQLNPGAVTNFLEVVASANADFDNDGDIDGGDLLALQRNNTALLDTWQQQYGGVNAVDGPADGYDFLRLQRDNPALLADWGAQYGEATPTVITNVPEPSAALLAALGWWISCGRLRRGRPSPSPH